MNDRVTPDPLADALDFQAQAARTGFDWREASELWAKLAEEIEELREAQTQGPERIEDELGDLLFMTVNLARHLGCDPAAALAAANTKFQRRFAQVIADPEALPPLGHPARIEAMERRWREAKRNERRTPGRSEASDVTVREVSGQPTASADSAPIRIGVLGAAGRMGRALIEALPGHPGLVLGALFEHAAHPLLGQEIVAGLPLLADLAGEASRYEVLIDFTRPEGTLAALETCMAHGRPMVIGTTGFDAEQRQRIEAAARNLALCVSGNYSVGVAVAVALVERAARLLGEGFDAEITDAHHRHKVDAPSGTALMLGEAAARGAGTTLAERAVWSRHGQTGARPAGAIGFSSVRGGDVVGDHSVLFLGDGERLEIAHRASSRANFAHGALRAAAWIARRPPGLYGIADILDLGTLR